QKPGPDAPPPEVAVSLPVAQQVVDYEEFTGRTEAAATVDLRARVTGYLDKILFKEGEAVKKGDVLFEIDPRPYKAEVARADAALVLAEAHRKLADVEFQRMKALLPKGVVSREDFDKAAAALDEATAAVNAAKPTCDVARIHLSFTKVLA